MKTIAQYLIALAMVILLALLANPFMIWMPSPVEMMMVLVAAILAVVYAGFVLNEGHGDEREMAHRLLSGRAAFLTALLVLTIALLYQGVTHSIDPWIPATLALTTTAKLISRMWANTTQ